MTSNTDHYGSFEQVTPYHDRGLLVFLRFDAFVKRNSPFAQTILNIIQSIACHFLLTVHKLVTLVQSDDAQLAFEPVGACPIILNLVERMNHLRQRYP